MRNKTKNNLPEYLKKGAGGGSPLKTISEKTKNMVKGLKEFFNPEKITKAVGGETTKKEPSKAQSKMESYAKGSKQKFQTETPSNFGKEEVKILGQIYNILSKHFDDKISMQEKEQNLLKSQQEKEKQKEQLLIDAIKGKKEEKKEEKKKKKKKEESSILQSALAGGVVAAGAAEKTEEEKVAREEKEKVKAKEEAPKPVEKPKAEPLPEQPKAPPPKVEPSPKAEEPKAKAEPVPKAGAPAAKAEKVPKGAGEAPVSTKGIPGMIAETLSKLGVSKKGQANVLAQVEAESGFKPRSESLKYKPETLLKMFPKYIKDIDDAKQLVAQGEEAIGNRIYGGRMGNAPDEGYKYRGRGFLQHTGKEQYEAIKKYTGVDVVSNPDLLNDPAMAAKAIPWFFLSYKRKKPEQLDNISEVNKAVGFVGGQDKHEARAQLAQKYEKQDLGTSSSSPAPTAVAEAPAPKSTEVASKSKENENLKESLDKPKPIAVATNTKSTNINQSTTASNKPQEEVDDRPIYLRKAIA